MLKSSGSSSRIAGSIRAVGVITERAGTLRVSAGTPEENDAFLDAVRELEKEQST